MIFKLPTSTESGRPPTGLPAFFLVTDKVLVQKPSGSRRKRGWSRQYIVAENKMVRTYRYKEIFIRGGDARRFSSTVSDM
jgi:hypothetical protein